MWSSAVKRLRVERLFEPTLAPAPVICELPLEAVEPAMTMAPTAAPGRKPGVSDGVDEPRKRKLAREKPMRAVLSRCEETTCCSCALSTWGAETLVDERKGILRRGVRDGVVDGVDREEEVAIAEVFVEAGGAEVFADVLGGIGEGLGDAGGAAVGVEQFGTVGHGPEIEQSGNTCAERDGGGAALAVGQNALPGLGVWNEGNVRQAEVLPIAFVVAEQEAAVVADGAAKRAAVVVALEVGDAGLVEVVAGVEEGVAEELVGRAVQSICAGRGYDGDLRSFALAVVGAVGVWRAR